MRQRPVKGQQVPGAGAEQRVQERGRRRVRWKLGRAPAASPARPPERRPPPRPPATAGSPTVRDRARGGERWCAAKGFSIARGPSSGPGGRHEPSGYIVTSFPAGLCHNSSRHRLTTISRPRRIPCDRNTRQKTCQGNPARLSRPRVPRPRLDAPRHGRNNPSAAPCADGRVAPADEVRAGTHKGGMPEEQYGAAAIGPHPRPRRSAAQPVPPSARDLQAARPPHHLQQTARREPQPDRCPGPQGPCVLRPVRPPRHRLSRGRPDRAGPSDPRHGQASGTSCSSAPATSAGRCRRTAGSNPRGSTSRRCSTTTRPRSARSSARSSSSRWTRSPRPCRSTTSAWRSSPSRPTGAQDVADQLVAAGVRGLLNFAPVSLNVPPDVALNAVDVAVQLEQLSFQVNVGSGGGSLAELRGVTDTLSRFDSDRAVRGLTFPQRRTRGNGFPEYGTAKNRHPERASPRGISGRGTAPDVAM